MNFRFRLFFDKAFKIAVTILSISVIVPLILILFHIVSKGVSSINLHFLIRDQNFSESGGSGILNSIVGTFLLITIASVFSVPLGIIAGLFLVEVKSRFVEFVRILVDVLHGIPSIVIGIVTYLLIVKPFGGFSAISGGIALGLMMFPLVVKSAEESLRLVPYSLREASFALGANYVKTIFRVVLPTCIKGIIVGTLIGISRIAGETAPLLFTAFGNPYFNISPFKPVNALPLVIFNYAMSPYEEWHRIAWGASLVLVGIIFLLNMTTKIAGKKWEVQF